MGRVAHILLQYDVVVAHIGLFVEAPLRVVNTQQFKV
jgi:hypothetical protein